MGLKNTINDLKPNDWHSDDRTSLLTANPEHDSMSRSSHFTDGMNKSRS